MALPTLDSVNWPQQQSISSDDEAEGRCLQERMRKACPVRSTEALTKALKALPWGITQFMLPEPNDGDTPLAQ